MNQGAAKSVSSTTVQRTLLRMGLRSRRLVKGTNRRLVFGESCGCEATHDPVFFNGAVHTGEAKLWNQFSSRAYQPSPMKQLRFRRQIVAFSHSNECQCSRVFFYDSVFALPGWQLQAPILLFKVK
ncbi:hypothetical protein AVEN_258094-1 [Araneus ventricosus]|uniref:Transposase Tc1-like domain-containing protein n=1 Tax=Araneus ventricosus TaxID=182803 RepID=A0A4Y2LGE1_ARAVE|nr:hypothetical protein AVEN_258094-1 [Araneus ventricosus]